MIEKSKKIERPFFLQRVPYDAEELHILEKFKDQSFADSYQAVVKMMRISDVVPKEVKEIYQKNRKIIRSRMAGADKVRMMSSLPLMATFSIVSPLAQSGQGLR